MVHLIVAIRCASGTRSSTRCCSRAVAVIRLQIREQIVDVPAPQILEHNVKVIKVIPQEHWQRMRFFTFTSVWKGAKGRG